jgi:translation initiation factor RLI1
MPLNYFNKIEMKQNWEMFKKSYMLQVDKVLKHIIKELLKTNNGKKKKNHIETFTSKSINDIQIKRQHHDNQTRNTQK